MLQSRIISAIKSRMSERKISQSNLAELLNTSDAWVSRVLSEKIVLSVNDLEKVCSVLQIDTLDLMQQSLLVSRERPFHRPDMQRKICQSELHFHLFYRLEEPQTIEQLQSHLPGATVQEIESALVEFFEEDLIIKTDDRTFRTADWRGNQYSLRPEIEYNQIISKLYSRQRGEPEKALKLAKDDLEIWKKRNTDAFYIGYFTDSQIESQIELARSFTAFVKAQTLYNLRTKASEAKHLRAIALSHLSFPRLTSE